MSQKKRVVVALGGNAILQPGQKGTAEEQIANVQSTVDQIVPMIAAGYEVIITHGNGPQVGSLLIQNEAGKDKVPPLPMDFCGAESQGFMGYMFCRLLRNSLAEAGLSRYEPVCLVTQVEVAADDPAFANPTKPVGPFYDAVTAQTRAEATGEAWVEDAGRGWRRVVPSPEPVNIVEKKLIASLVAESAVVVASGGGGIPVVRTEKGLAGIEAVIDKDLAGELLARELEAHIFMILTDVPAVAIHYGTTEQRWLDSVSCDEMFRYFTEGHFKAGSMGPKVKAAMRFVENGGERAIIATLTQALEALKGEAGTSIHK